VKKSKRNLITICIPTFNGEAYLAKTLQSIAPFLGSGVDLVIVDDASSDSTLTIAQQFSSIYRGIKIYRNQINIGMDRNFLRAVELSTSEYIWFCGQDDLIGKEAIEAVKLTLRKTDLIALNCNFAQFNHDYSKCNFASFFDLASFEKYHQLKFESLLVFKSPSDYFEVFTQPPSFLPSVILKKTLFNGIDTEEYLGTHFVQVGIFLEHMHVGLVGALTKPLVRGRVPNDAWQRCGSKLHRIMSGDLRAKKIAFERNILLPKAILERDLFRFVVNYPFLLASSYRLGFKPETGDFEFTRIVFKSRYLYYALVRLVQSLPPALLVVITDTVHPFKKLLLSLDWVKRLRA
jgi:glycosyltransferase involved in cell wall biosynthesis